MCRIFTQLPEDLINHILWKDCSENYKWGCIAMLRLSSFTGQPKQGIRKGQVKMSSQDVADGIFELIGKKIPRKTAWRMISHFKGINSHGKVRGDVAAGLRPILVDAEVEQKVEHEKGLYNILLKGYYEICDTASDTASDTPSDTEVTQKCHTSRGKNATEAKKLRSLEEQNNPPGRGDYAAPSVRRVFSFNEQKKEFQGICQSDLDGWTKRYTNIDINAHFPAMIQWQLENRTEAERKVIHRKFFTDWLSKQQAKAERDLADEEKKPQQNLNIEKNREEATKFVLKYAAQIVHYQRLEVNKTFIIFKDTKKDQKIQMPFSEADFTNQLKGLKNYLTFRREYESKTA